MNTKHTPGPWSYEWSDYGGYDCMWSVHTVDGPDGEEIAQMHAMHPLTHDRDETQEANARLIAAAPEMLAALEHVRGEIGAWKNEPECNCEDCVMLRPVYAAIAKATGEDAP